MNAVEKIKGRLSQIESQQNSILNKSGEMMTATDQVQYDALGTEADNLKGVLADVTSFTPGRQTTPDRIPDTRGIASIPAMPKQKLNSFSDARTALNFGRFVLAAAGNRRAEALLNREGIQIGAAMSEGVNDKGGYLVPGEFLPDLIRLVEERGIARQEGRIITMSQDTISVPRRVTGSTAYFVNEADAITASDMTLDLITLSLKKAGVLTSMSQELSDDALIAVADILAQDFAYAIADKEDECMFNGTGAAAYGHMTGIRQQLIQKALGGDATSAVPAASGLIRYGTGYAYTNIAMVHLTDMIAKLPSYAEANAKWYGSKRLWGTLLDLMADAGGNTLQTLSSGPSGRQFLGYPYVVVDVMPKAAATNQVCLLLGDLKKAAAMGVHRRGLSIESSNSATVGSTNMFETDQIAIRGTERFDVNVHDVGSTTAAGPMVGLISHTA